MPEDTNPWMAGAYPAETGGKRKVSGGMYKLQKKSKEYAELERKQEEEQRRRLLELEKQAVAASVSSVRIATLSVSEGLD